jgi:transcriptional regulator with XRE-family HTH domain
VAHVAHKFEHLLQTYRRSDGREWSGAQLAKATGGVVPRSYVTNLRKGRIESPGYEKLAAIASAMGFPPEVWFEENLGSGGELDAALHASGVAGKVEHLFETAKNPKTGEPYTNGEVARLSAGDLTVEDVEGIRTGKIADPLVSQVAALAAAFGVPPSYLLDRGKESSVLDEEVLEALADETAGAILRESARLPEREKEIVLGIVRQFGSQIDEAYQ